ncbi:Flp pilus assembly protein CpaB [Bradyrhizobium sp. Ash2021]|uniref:Flp pilus assembly protein CpaB n=1 Tax=Bradyrhizobium sp. Ash2021 TaxID=2954771 RepID=UPI002815459F|nr:Flp pilus assembly protein CpaB [Bradyrhizobium sp. Ash2021]WMT78214.1 Flp pilus assembly protein CpaB [Bradyrhizobium sp. Ash2021]
MSSSLRLSIILVFLLATTALGLIAYNMNVSKAQVPVQVTEKASAPLTRYLVAARPLKAGTLTRDEDFRSEPLDSVPAGAIRDTTEDRNKLLGSLVRKNLDTGSLITSENVLLRGDRGFLASVLEPGTRAISIKVDAESGVSGLIKPGDYVDVVLTQVVANADVARRALSETLLQNVRIIAIDQEIVQGGGANNTTAAKVAQTVSLQLAPEQVKKIAVAKNLGSLSLAMRSAVELRDTADSRTISSCDVSPEIARQNAIAGQSAAVVVYGGGKVQEYSVRKQDSTFGCGVLPKIARESETVVVHAADEVEAVKPLEKRR